MRRRQLYPRPRDSFRHPSDLQPHLSHQRQQCNAASSASFSHDAWPRTCAKGGGTSAMSATSSIASQSARRQRHTLTPAKSSLSPFSRHSSWVDFRARCFDEGLRKISRRPPSSDSWLRRDTSRTASARISTFLETERCSSIPGSRTTSDASTYAGSTRWKRLSFPGPRVESTRGFHRTGVRSPFTPRVGSKSFSSPAA